MKKAAQDFERATSAIVDALQDSSTGIYAVVSDQGRA